MNIDIDDIDVDSLRDDLKDYFTSAMFIASPVALMDLSEVENASDVEVVQIALNNGFNLSEYTNTNGFRRY